MRVRQLGGPQSELLMGLVPLLWSTVRILVGFAPLLEERTDLTEQKHSTATNKFDFYNLRKQCDETKSAKSKIPILMVIFRFSPKHKRMHIFCVHPTQAIIHGKRLETEYTNTRHPDGETPGHPTDRTKRRHNSIYRL